MSIITFAQGVSNDPREALRGITSLAVATQQSGCTALLDQEVLKQDAELKLRLAGIRVSPLPVFQLNVASNCVALQQNGTRILTAINLTLFVSQIVWLPPQPVRVVIATTWQQQALIVCGAARKCDDEVRSSLGNNLDKFLNDYLAMNPK